MDGTSELAKDAFPVGGEDERSSVVGEELEDAGFGGGIEMGGRFVGEDELRVRSEGEGDEDALAFAAAELMGVGVTEAWDVESKGFEDFGGR